MATMIIKRFQLDIMCKAKKSFVAKHVYAQVCTKAFNIN